MATTAAIVAAVVGAGASVHSSNEQAKAQKQAQQERKKVAEEERRRLEELAKNTKPEEENATVEFGLEDSGEIGNYGEFMVKPQKMGNALGSSGASGIGSLAMK